MTAPRIVPCLWLDDQAEAAARHWIRALGGRLVAASRYPESFDNPARRPRGSVLAVELEAGGVRFTALNGGPRFRPNPSVSFFVMLPSADEVDRVHEVLAEGGETLMPLRAWPWSERYGWVQDRYGVSWQLMLARDPGPRVVPCLLFAGAQAGRAEVAMAFWTAALPGGRVVSVSRYQAGEGPVGQVKHGRFQLLGQDLAATDSHLGHGFAFDEGVSLQVRCRDQAEVDRCWAILADGGSHGRCGWLRDRFGVSWQVVPDAITHWLSEGVPAARERACRAIWSMEKLDAAAIDGAWEGEGGHAE
ncbi:MAG TPA: VOC family protein [Anaeromyxobacteraceae bacterium]|nr:VOC family protein [Anaeromyxobacteraceae bacterium]